MADQKINIIFTGDVSQLKTAMQQADKELEIFEAKLKESLGTDAFAAVNKSIDQLKQKLASLQTIDIKANPGQALSVIKEVSTSLNTLKASDILLKIDDGKALGQISNIDKLLDSLTATITIDTSGFKPQIEKIKSDFASLKLPELNGLQLVSGVDAAIKDIQSKLASLADEKLNISANGEQAETVINEILSDIKTLRDAKVLINADGTQAEGVIDRIQDELKTLKGSLSIDTTEFQRKLGQITSGISEIKLKADTSEIDLSIKAIREKLASINITANPDDAFAALREISSELNKIKSSQVFIDLNDDKAVKQISDLDKLLDSLTATIRIDADVKAQIDKIKSQLAGFTIDINADASNTETVLKNIQSRLSLLQDEKFIISADGKQAEAIIDEIFADLKNLKDTKVLINADGTPALSTLESIQNKLEETLRGGKLTIDTSELQRKLDSIKSLAGELTIESDFSQVESSIKSIREKLAAFKTIDINANPQLALTAINEILSQISKIKSNELILKSDNTDVLADINQIQTRLQDIKSTIKITADLDTSKLQSLITPLSQKVSIGVNTKQAEVEIKALLEQVRNLKGQDILINLDGTQVLRTVDAIEKELLNLQVALKRATNPADIAKLTQQLQLFKNSLSATSVNQFSSTMNRAQNATFAFSQVLREAPAFAFSFQTGILALSNNLPILADRLKEARAAGLSTGTIFKDMAKSLVSLPGILTIASTAAIFIAGAFSNSGKSAKEAARDIKDYGEIVDDATSSVQGDIAKVNALAKAFGETSSFEKQKRILSELKNINESYFGDLKTGKDAYELITKAANEYTQALVQQAIVEGLQEEISELAKQIRGATKEYFALIKPTDDARKASVAAEAAVSNTTKAVTSQNTQLLTASTRYQALNEKLKAAGGRVGSLQKDFNDLILEIQKAIGIQLNFKPLTKDPLPKDVTDDIISRARAFVKQFGETFVVPDLDESFTNTKDKILKSAKQLLDDIKNLNLKIKIPVQVITEADFLPVQFDFKDTKKEIEEVTKGFFEGVKLEKQSLSVPVEITPNFITKDQTKAIDELIKQFLSFGDRGLKALQKIDFSDINSAIADSQKALQRLNEEFQITGEVGLAVGESFSSAFNAILDNEDPIKAFFRSIISELQRLIAKLIATKIAAAFLKLAFPGIGTALSLLGSLTSVTGGQANFGFGGSGSLRAISVNISGSVIQRGTDMIIGFNNSGRSLGRIQ